LEESKKIIKDLNYKLFEIDNLKENLRKLSDERDQLKQERDQLKQDRDHLKQERDELNTKINELNYQSKKAIELEKLYKDALAEKEKVASFYILEKKNNNIASNSKIQELVSGFVDNNIQKMLSLDKKVQSTFLNTKKKFDNMKQKVILIKKNIAMFKKLKESTAKIEENKETYNLLDTKYLKLNEKYEQLQKKIGPLETVSVISFKFFVRRKIISNYINSKIMKRYLRSKKRKIRNFKSQTTICKKQY